MGDFGSIYSGMDDGELLALAELLKGCVSGKGPDEAVFTRGNGKPVKDFRKKWKNACIALGLGQMEPQEDGRLKYVGLLVHDLRRSAVRNMERAGVPRSVAMKITGHKTEATYRRYAIVDESQMAEASRKIEQRRKISHSLVTVGPERSQSPAPTNQLSN